MASTAAPLKSAVGEAPPVRWAIIGVLSLGMVIAYVSRSALSVPLALPEFFWTYAVLQIPAGWLVDRYGVKLPYFLGFTIWCLASASTALTRSIPELI